ncbi:hypothetical protein [Lentzea sp. NPDC003310]|uniref:hypothetical protein n=1 Tax=Lentzea sp. NPDC003310 TaxID=3154447 RepID=UPI0033BF3C41
MATRHIIGALVADWDRVTGLLGDDGRRQVRELVGAVRSAAKASQRVALAHALTRILGERLPHDDPVFAEAGPRRTSAEEVASLDRLLVSLSGDPLRFGRPRSAEERILTHDWESAAKLRAHGHVVDVPGVIRLPRDDGTAAVPLFQFDECGEPLEVVVRVNRVLRAHDDPWGAADWWFSTNVWLAGPPFDLVDRLPDDVLVTAAVAVVEG